ncbi:hypothetical protein HDV64DRAFT_262071 [Trichoderma sp. TUCIM 5745]
MRGLGKAATLILAPAAVLARPLPVDPTSSRGAPASSAFSVAVAIDSSGSKNAKSTDQTLVFNLDIEESSEACNDAKVRIDGFLLSQDDNGTGQGTFASLDGHTVTASWNFTCKEHVRRVPWDQDLALTIMSLDGEAVPETTFFTSFRQRTPVKVYDIGGDSVVYTTEGHAPTRLDQEKLLDKVKEITGLTQVDDEVKAEIKGIISMEQQINELRELVVVKQRKVLDGLGISPSTPAFNLQTFYQTARLASSTLRGTMEHWVDSVLGYSPDKHHRHRHHRHPHRYPHHREEDLVVSMQVDGEGGQHFFYYRDRNSNSTRLTAAQSRRHVTYAPLFAIIFTFHLGLFFILRSIRQRSHTRRASNLSNRQHRREARAQRRCQRRARRAGFKQSIRDFLCNFRDLFRTKHIELNEKTSMLINSRDEEDASMEDELASFQEAASVVSDMVAAEEERRAARRDESLPPRITEDVSPPAYDEAREIYDEKRPDGN